MHVLKPASGRLLLFFLVSGIGMSACRTAETDKDHPATQLNPITIAAPADMAVYRSGDSVRIQVQSTDTSINLYAVSVYSETEGSMLYHRVFYADADCRQMPDACWVSHVHVPTLATLRIEGYDRKERQYSKTLRLLINP